MSYQRSILFATMTDYVIELYALNAEYDRSSACKNAFGHVKYRCSLYTPKTVIKYAET